jgi:hypothetical protein
MIDNVSKKGAEHRNICSRMLYTDVIQGAEHRNINGLKT